MTKRTVVIAVVILLAMTLLYVLVAHADMTWGDASRALENMGMGGFVAILSLTALNLTLSTVKWHVVVRAAAPESCVRLEFVESMLTTTAGAILGQVIPIQVGVSLTRSVAGRFGVGSSPAVNFGTTAYEQLFDAMVLGIAGAVGIIAVLVDPGPVGWLLLVAILLAVTRVSWFLVRSRLASLPQSIWLREHSTSPIGKLALAAACAAQFPPSIVVQLLFLSGLRYVVVLLRAAVVLAGVDLWAVAAPAALAFPVVQIVGFLPLTPGNLGVLESTWVGLLVYAGAAFNAAVLFSITIRVMNLVAQVGVFSMLLLVRLLPRPSTT